MIRPRLPLKRNPAAKKGFMTIAAGFNFSDGVLLCADTQFSGGSVKLFDSKMFQGSIGDGTGTDFVQMAVAMSGTDGYMQLAVERCYDALFALIPKTEEEESEISPFRMRDVLGDALVEFYKKHIFEHKLYGYQDGPHVELLLAIRLRDENTKLYWTQETTVNICDDGFKCVGSGAVIAMHAIKPYFRNPFTEGMPLNDTILLATHALKVAKDSDPYCGGESEFAILYDNGESGGVSRYDISRCEEYSSVFSMLLKNLFYAGADLNISERELEDLMRDFSAYTSAIREEQAKEIRERKRLEKQLAKKTAV